jgi:hypothetical protein
MFFYSHLTIIIYILVFFQFFESFNLNFLEKNKQATRYTGAKLTLSRFSNNLCYSSESAVQHLAWDVGPP